MDAMDELYYALRALRSEKKSIDREFLNDVKDLFTETMEGLPETTGEYLHNLHQKKPSKQTLKMMIDAVPSSLSYYNMRGELPIQSAVRKSASVAYIPLLAIEGVRYNVGGADKRGGLHVENSYGIDRRNVLKLLVKMRVASNPEPDDMACLNAIKELKESNLFHKQDIQDYDLLNFSCHTTTQLRFQYLAQMDPEGLKSYRWKPLIHRQIIGFDTTEVFQLFLATALKHHPDDTGLLFQTNDEGKQLLSAH